MKGLEGDLGGRTAVVTGANTGIGKEVARGLLTLGARVVLACRSPERGEAARAELLTAIPGAEAEVQQVDLSSQASIRAAAAALLARHPRIELLINNAGVWLPSRQESVDGVEMTWATNTLGYFLLTELLLERLLASAPARVINVASDLAGGLDLDDLDFRRRRYDGVAAYRQSKQGNRLLTWQLARRLEGSGVTAHALHPGSVATEIGRHPKGVIGALVRGFMRLYGRSPAEGADTPVWLAAGPEGGQTSGKLWKDRRELPCRFRDPALEERLEAVCRSRCGL